MLLNPVSRPFITSLSSTFCKLVSLKMHENQNADRRQRGMQVQCLANAMQTQYNHNANAKQPNGNANATGTFFRLPTVPGVINKIYVWLIEVVAQRQLVKIDLPTMNLNKTFRYIFKLICQSHCYIQSQKVDFSTISCGNMPPRPH